MQSSRIRFGVGAAVLSLATLALTPQALAQAEDQAASRALFDEGRRFADSGKYDQACPKFEAARKLYISAGILLNLGDCYEKIGRTASAWTTFGEAASVANRTKRIEDAAEAKRRQALLEPRLDRLSIHVTREEPGLTVRWDGVEVPSAAWDEPIPVDPGPHEIRVEALGYAPWAISVSLSPQEPTTTVDVPELRPAQTPRSATGNAAAPAATGSAATASEWSVGAPAGSDHGIAGQRVTALVVGGVGILAMATGGVLGLVAKAQDSAAESEPWPARHTDSASAVSLGNAGTVVAVTGAVATAAGVIIWMTAPTAAGPQVGMTGQEVVLRGTF
jgi:hypothetical protein